MMNSAVADDLVAIVPPLLRTLEMLGMAARHLNPPDLKALVAAAGNVLALGPMGIRRYLRDSRLRERVVSRLRARMMGAF